MDDICLRESGSKQHMGNRLKAKAKKKKTYKQQQQQQKCRGLDPKEREGGSMKSLARAKYYRIPI